MGKKQTLDQFVAARDAQEKAEHDQRNSDMRLLKPHLDVIGNMISQKLAIVLNVPVNDIQVTDGYFGVIITATSSRRTIKISIVVNPARFFFMDGYRWSVRSIYFESQIIYPTVDWSRNIPKAIKGINNVVEKWIKSNIAFNR